MPIHREGGGWQWGTHGKVYASRAGAERQAAAAHANGYAGDAAPRAAGVLLRAPTGRVLWLLRGPDGDQPGTWCLPGGGAEGDETPDVTALRELREETGYALPVDMLGDLVHESEEPVNYATFAGEVPAEFVPTLNDENVAHAWAPLSAPPAPLHPGVEEMLKALSEQQAQDESDEANRYEWREGDFEVLHVGTETAPESEPDEDDLDTSTDPTVTLHLYPEEETAQ